MALKFHESVIENLSLMLTNGNGHDIKIRVGTNQNAKEFLAHSNILKSRSTYFKAALSADWIVKENNIAIFQKPNINPDIFELILKYIYTGEVDLTNKSPNDILDLLVASDELLLEELFKGIQVVIMEDKSPFIRSNFVRILNTTFKIPKCKELIKYCVESICADHNNNNSDNSELSSLEGDSLYELLKRDDLLIEESVIWENLMKWGIKKTPGLESENSDVTKWNDKDYEALKETLNKFIPLVRFSEMSSADFYDKVLPFKAILPDKIYENAMKFYMKGILPKTTFSPRIGKIKIDSRIIKPKLAYIIANWIDGNDAKTIQKQKDRYKFDLLYRCDSGWKGIDLQEFRKKVGRGPYFILIKQIDITHNNNNNHNNDLAAENDRWDSPNTPTSSVSEDDWHLDKNWDPNTDPDNASEKIYGEYVENIDISHISGYNDNSHNSTYNDNSHNSIYNDNSRNSTYNDNSRNSTYNDNSRNSTYNDNYTTTYHRIYNNTNNTPKGFVFSFDNDNDTKNMKISRANHHNSHEYSCKSNLSNNFYVEGNQFICVRGSKHCDCCDRNNIINSNISFGSYDFEVFQVIKTVRQ